MAVTTLTLEERVADWMRREFGERIRLRRGEVCDAMRAFGVIRDKNEFSKLVDAGLMSAMPPVNGERRASYHRDAVSRFIVANCREGE